MGGNMSLVQKSISLVLVAGYFASCAHQAPRPMLDGTGQQTFDSTEQAASTLFAAVKDKDRAALQLIFGPKSDAVLYSGDPVEDDSGLNAFRNLYQEKHQFENTSPTAATLLVGRDESPFPIPLVESGKRWRFDTQAGAEEIINRRIGDNELNAISLCEDYFEAQQDYYSADWDRNGVAEYAKLFFSTVGKKDGLFWPRRPGEAASPFGPIAAQAVTEGYKRSEEGSPRPFHGYYFRILTGQGSHADGGKKSYLNKKGQMTKGFAMAAYPARWGVSGIMTFIVNQDGLVFQKNLGETTGEAASKIAVFDPDDTWEPVEE